MELIKKNKDSTFKKYWPVFAVFVFVTSMIMYEIVNTSNSINYEIKNGFKGIVTSKFINKSWVYVGLLNQTKKQQIDNGYNYAYEIPRLINFINVGDEVMKNECSDTVYIKRGINEYHFIQLAYWYNNESKTKEYKLKYMVERLTKLSEKGCNIDSIALEVALELSEK